MKYYPEMYIGIKRDRNNLAFLKPKKNIEKDDEKAQNTILSWFYYGESKNVNILQNKPVEGFEVIGFSSRYSTDNKHILVKHPNGFTFEITVENLTADILPQMNIIKGLIEGECIIVSTGQKLNLVGVKTESYKKVYDHSLPKIKFSELPLNCTLKLFGESGWIYLGRKKIKIGSNDLPETKKSYYCFYNQENQELYTFSANKDVSENQFTETYGKYLVPVRMRPFGDCDKEIGFPLKPIKMELVD